MAHVIVGLISSCIYILSNTKYYLLNFEKLNNKAA